MFCKNCGKKLPDRSGICPNCGSDINDDKDSSLVTMAIIIAIVIIIGSYILAINTDKDNEKVTLYPENSTIHNSTVETTTEIISEPNEEITAEKIENQDKTYIDEEAKEIFQIGQEIFATENITGTGIYTVGDNSFIDDYIKNYSSFADKYSIIVFYLDKGEVLSVYCYNYHEDEERKILRIQTYPEPYTDENLFSDYSPLYLAMDSVGRKRFNNNEASTFSTILVKSLESISSVADGNYSLDECPEELYNKMSEITDISRFLEYKMVNFSINTIDGEYFISVNISVDGEITGSFPAGTESIGDYIS